MSVKLEGFEYKVVGFLELESTASFHIFEVLKSGKTNLASGVLHQYPFDTLPYIKLHVRPHFVIYNTGEKMRRRFGPYIKADADNRRQFVANQLGADMADHLLKMYDIYRAWISCDLPTKKFEELERPEKNLRQSAGDWRQFYNLKQELGPEDYASLASFRVYCTSSGGLIDEDAMSDTSCRTVTDDGMEPLSDYVKRWRRGVPPGASDIVYTNEMPEQQRGGQSGRFWPVLSRFCLWFCAGSEDGSGAEPAQNRALTLTPSVLKNVYFPALIWVPVLVLILIGRVINFHIYQLVFKYYKNVML